MSDETTTQATGSGEEQAAGVSQNVPQCPNGRGGDNLSDAQSSAGLSDAQLHAIELLIAGTAPSKVAEECFVDRRTIYRWREEHEPFRAELERRRRELWSAASDRIRAMILTSLRILNDDLQEQYQDTRRNAATTVLRVTNVRKLIEAEMTGGGE